MTAEIRINTFSVFLSIPFKLIGLLHQLLLKIFPPSSSLKRTGNIYVETLGLAGLFLFLININLSGSLNENGETMLIIAFLLSLCYWGKVLIRQPLFWLTLAFAVSLVISTMIGMENFPESRHKSEAKRMARLCLFVPLAWWIGANFVSIRNAFLIVCTGFIISSLWMLDWDTLSPLLEGTRAQSNITGLGAGDFGAWYGFMLMGFGILGKELLPDWLKKNRAGLMGYIFFVLIILFLLTGLYVSFWRTGWIAATLTLALGLSIRYHVSFKDKQTSFKNFMFPALVVVLLLFFVASKFEVIKNRFLSEGATVTHVISGHWDQVEKGSLAQRFLMYKWAFETESFVTAFGWGPRSIQAISRNEELNEELQWNPARGHLHNDLLSITFRTGILGASIFFLIFFFLARGTYIGYREKVIPKAFYTFFMMCVLYSLIIGLATVTFRMHVFLPVWMGLIFASIIGRHNNEDTHTNVRSYFLMVQKDRF